MNKISKKALALGLCCAICGTTLFGMKKAEAASMSVSGTMVYGSISYDSSSKSAVATTYSPESYYLLRANIEYNLGNGTETAGAADAYGTAVKTKTFSKKTSSLKGRHRIKKDGSWSAILYS